MSRSRESALISLHFSAAAHVHAGARVRTTLSFLSLFVFAACPDSSEESSSAGDPPIMCGDNECDAGQLCVTPGSRCDASTNPPKYVDDPPACAPVPDGCAPDDLDCVAATLCEGIDNALSPATLMEGQLDCPSPDPDCF